MFQISHGRGSNRGRLGYVALTVLAATMGTVVAQASELPGAPYPDFPSRASHGGPVLLGEYALPVTPIQDINPWLSADTIAAPMSDGAGGIVDYSVNPAIGSGLHYEGIEVSPDAQGRPVSRHVFYGVTDIGASEKCANADSKSKFHATPEFAATMVKFSLDDLTGDIVMEQAIPLLSSPGVHTRSRDPKKSGDVFTDYNYDTGECFTPVAQPALSGGAKKDDALDAEDLYRFASSAPGGPTYLIAEEFGPSIFVTDETGRVMKSYTHPSDAASLDTTFETVGIFPDALGKARRGRGFESLAVSANEKFAWTILQSPATNTKFGAGSNILRAYKLDISDPLDISVVGEYLYEFAPFDTWLVADPTLGSNKDLKVSAIDWLAPNMLLIGERAKSDGLLAFVADFSTATNILGTPESLLTDNMIETRIAELGIRMPTKDLRFNLADLNIAPVSKMEGLRAVTNTTLVMIEDADFAWQTRLWVVQLPKPLPGGPKYSIEQRRPHHHSDVIPPVARANAASAGTNNMAPVSDD